MFNPGLKQSGGLFQDSVLLRKSGGLPWPEFDSRHLEYKKFSRVYLEAPGVRREEILDKLASYVNMNINPVRPDFLFISIDIGLFYIL